MRVVKLFILLLIISSCNHYRWAVKNKDKLCQQICVFQNDSVVRYVDTVIVAEMDTVIKSDTSWIKFLIDCDSLNNVLISQLDSKGKVQFKYIYKDKVLYIRAITPELAVKLRKNIAVVKQVITEIKKVNIQSNNDKWWLVLVIVGFLILLMLIK